MKKRFYQSWWRTKSLRIAYHTYLTYWFLRNSILGNWKDGKIPWVEALFKLTRRIRGKNKDEIKYFNV